MFQSHYFILFLFLLAEGQAFNLVISIIVSAAAGTVLGVALTSEGGNQLVGTAISAGLLPPIVNAGMLFTYAMAYAKKDKGSFYEMSGYSILFFLTHVATIVIVANLVFWLKDIDKNAWLKDKDDENFDDFEGLRLHREKLISMGQVSTHNRIAIATQ